jgi:hypothetical protein
VLPATGVLHRGVWNLRYAAPRSTTHGYPISAVPHATPREPQGPLALPGSYLVRLTVDGRALEEPLTLEPDPRVRLPDGALSTQLELATELAGLLTESSQALSSARSEQAQLKDLKATGAAAQAASDFEKRLTALLESKESANGEPQTSAAETMPVLLPDVQGRISALYAELLRGDAPPTAAQLSASATLKQTLAGLLTGWRQLQSDLPALNRQLKSAALAAVRADLAPPRDANLADEE